MFATLPELPYSWIKLRRLCGIARRQVPLVTLAELRIRPLYIIPETHLPGKLLVEHAHACYEAHLLLSGDVQYLSGTPQLLHPGHFFVLPPNTPHAWQVLEQPCLDLLLIFHLEPALTFALPERWTTCPALFWELALLLDDVDRQGAGEAERATARLTAIFSCLLAVFGWPAQHGVDDAEAPEMLVRLERFVEDNLAAPLTLDQIAAGVGLSRRTLSRLFRQRTGLSVMEYLRNFRVSASQGLLTNTDLTVGAVGRTVGMPDSTNFCRFFHQRTGLTPQEYRRQHQAP